VVADVLTDPLSPEQFHRMQKALAEMTWAHGPMPEETRERYGVIIETLWHVGWHPSVFTWPRAEIRRRGPTFGVDAGGSPKVSWRRPKTRRVCSMPIPPNLAPRLKAYLDTPAAERYSVRQIERLLGRIGDAAGIDGVTPLTFRHTVGSRITRALGPSAAKASLGVSDRSLQAYTALSEDRRLADVRDLLHGGH
jgi:integrase